MGLSTAFLTGFVDAANRDRYETRMAAHEESVEARADFQWKERNTEAIARQDKLLADSNAREDLKEENAEQRIIDGNLAIMQRFYPNMPEADQLKYANNPNGVGYIPGYHSGGLQWDPDKGNFETQADRDTRVAGVQAMHLRRSDVSDEIFQSSQWFAFLRDTIVRTGESEMDLRNRGYSPVYKTDSTTGAVISITPKYTNPDIPEPYQITASNDISFNELKLTQYNKLNRIVSLPLDQFGKPLEPGILTGIVEGLTGVAVTKYADARTNGEALLPSEPFSEVFAQAFGPNHEHMEHISEEKLQMGANAISTYGNNPEGLASAEESLDTLESVYENIRVRIHITEMYPRVDLTGGTNLQTLYDIHRGIRNNPVFIAEYGPPQGEAAVAEVVPTTVDTRPDVVAAGTPYPGGYGQYMKDMDDARGNLDNMEKIGASRLKLLENYRQDPRTKLEAIENQEKQLERANAIIERAKAKVDIIKDNWNAQYGPVAPIVEVP